MTESEAQMAQEATNTEEDSKMDATNGDGTIDEPSGDATNAPGDAEERKLFCGGLSQETTEADLRSYFEKFGEIEACTVKMNPMTQKSRCFGFVTFATKQGLEDAIAGAPHTVKGKQIDPKPAKARPGANKVFCGGLPPETTEEEIRAHFGEFGPIESLELPMDKEKNVRRGFIFVTFETVAAADAAAKQAKQTINGKECDIKKATPKNATGPGGVGRFGGGRGGGGFGMRGGRGGGGRGGAGWAGAGGRGMGYGGQQAGWGGYGASGGYGGGYGGYDTYGYGNGYGTYGGWGGQNGGGGAYGGASQWPQSGGSYGKQQGRGGSRSTTAQYHPYR